MSLTDCINLILFALIQYNKTPVKAPFYRHFTGFLQFYGRSVKQLEFKDVLEIIDDKPRKIVVFVTNVSLTVHNYYFSLVLFSVDFSQIISSRSGSGLPRCLSGIRQIRSQNRQLPNRSSQWSGCESDTAARSLPAVLRSQR